MVDESELHDFTTWLKYVRSQINVASIGSVRCCTSARSAKRMSYVKSVKYWKGLNTGSPQLFGFSGVATVGSVCPNLEVKFCSPSGNGDADSFSGTKLGERSLTGETEPWGRGIFAANVMSPSSSCTLSYLGLVPLEWDALPEALSKALSCGYGWCWYQPPTAFCCLQAGGDHGSPDSSEARSSSDSDSSDLNPECCEGRPKRGERGHCSKSSSDAVSDG